MINKVEICGVNTTKLPILSNEEKKELLLKIKNGDKDAREKFINGNLRLVLSVVQRFSGRAESADDLFQIGCIGLIKAIDNFDINLNVQFSTYAVPMIIGEIRRYLRDNNSIRVSRSIKDLAYKSIAFKNKFLKENNREPTIEEIAKEYPSSKIIIGGHSKGGNIAVYAATFASKEVKDRIINVYNNDGPGFCEDVIETAEYQKILSRVHTYIPQSSIIGRLMNHKEKYTIVESVQKGIMQHDLYSWQLLGKEFVTLKKLTNESEFIDKTIKDWLENVEPEKREQVIDAVFEILNTTEAQTMKELKANWFANAKTILGTYKNIDSDTKEMVWQTVNELLKVAKNNIFEELPKIADN